MKLGSGLLRPRWLVALAALLIAGGVIVALNGRPADRAAQRPSVPAAAGSREAVLTVTAAELRPVEVNRTITINGSIFAWQEVIIAPEVGGYRVAEVKVDVGDHVKRGQTLVELSTALLDAEVATKNAALAQREAQLVADAAGLDRGESLKGMNLISQADYDKLKSAALTSRAGVESARADLQSSALRLKFTNVTAPDDGVITSRTVTVGQIAQAGGEMLRLLRNGRIEWRGEAPEARLGELKPGQPVKLTTADGAIFDGTIRVVAPTIQSGNRTGLIYVDLPANDRLRPGMFARGDIEISRAMAFTVPLQSVVSADGYSYVFVLKPDNRVERRHVETGAVHDSEIEVSSGITGGDMVVGKGAGFLKDGDLVNVSSEAGS
ncbi:MAG TPA: efflux RND transporter periplasmic adaptor subunit [Gammaproteobacteria bacterium]|nr:efflux RND transporter periplasmic adaptor subunit [Gammaproteobacteria bacterium]